MPKLLIMPTRNQQAPAWVDRLRDDVPELTVSVAQDAADAEAQLADADAAFGWIAPEQLPHAQKLRWLQSPQAGPPKGFYYDELIAHPVVITNLRGIYNDHIAQHIMMYTLALARGLPAYMGAQGETRWDTGAPNYEFIDLKEASALIVGVGGIGHETARLCNAFGMRVLAVDERWEYDVPDVERHGPDALDELLPEADFVIVTVPHTPQTEGMWQRKRFARMKSSGFFINIGRGATTKLDDLAAALQAGEIAGCALDVYEVEPLPAEHPLWTLPNVILTPHVAAKDGHNLSERRYGVIAENARRFVAGEELINVVDKSVWY